MDRKLVVLAVSCALLVPALLRAQDAAHSPKKHASAAAHADTAGHHPVPAKDSAHGAKASHEEAAHGQAAHGAPISASRPGLAEYTGTVGAGRVQVEGGYSLLRLEGKNKHSFGEMRVRAGLGSRGEVRVDLNSYSTGYDHGHTVSGFQDVDVSFKAQLRAEHAGSVVPGVALFAGSSIPTGSAKVGQEAWQPETGLSLGWSLPGHVSLTATSSYVHQSDHGKRVGQLTTAASVGFPVAHHLHGHAEYAAIAPTDHLSDRLHHVSGGFGYHVNDDLQLDVWVGGASFHGHRELLFGVGFSRRW